jgi:hypothetical protein
MGPSGPLAPELGRDRMKTFIVHAKNRPGEMATLTGALSSRNVNVLITGLTMNGQGVAAFVASDEEAAQAALKDAGYEFKTFPALTIRLTDKPGQAQEVARLLGAQDINIECFIPVRVTDDEVIVALGLDRIEDARKVLGDMIVEFVYS